MAALSAAVFALSWWLGLYLLARDPRKPVLVLAATGLTSFAAVVALDAVRTMGGVETLGRIEIYLVAVPGIAWFAVLVELSRPRDTWRGRAGEFGLVAVSRRRKRLRRRLRNGRSPPTKIRNHPMTATSPWCVAYETAHSINQGGTATACAAATG